MQTASRGLRGRLIGRHALQVHAKSNVHQSAPKQSKLQQASAASYIALDQDKLYNDGSYLPQSAFGPVKLTNVQGHGRGLVLTAPAGNGTLLMVSQPAGRVVRAAEGLALQTEHLLPALQQEGVLSDDDKRRLRLLFNGQSESTRTADLSEFMSNSAQAELLKTKKPKAQVPAKSKGFGKPIAPATPAQAAGDSGDASQSSSSLTADELASVVRYNMWGQEYADLGAVATRGEKSHSYLGVWPEYALVNHSCIPNTVVVMVGDRLLLRAARAQLPAGTHGCSPVSERRRKLMHTYGFECNCPRCKLESALPSEINSLVEDMWGWLSQGIADRVRGQLASGDRAAAKVVEVQLQRHVDRLEDLLEEKQVPAEARDWVRASAYGCYELLAILKDSLQQEGEDPEGEKAVSLEAGDLPKSLVPLIETVLPGTDAHLFLTLEWLNQVGSKWGSSATQTHPAAMACLTAHMMRYGRVSDKMLTQLMTERSTVDHYMGRVSLPSRFAAAPASPSPIPVSSATPDVHTPPPEPALA